MDRLYQDLNKNSSSIHLSEFPDFNEAYIDHSLESQMQLAQSLSSSILSLRKKEKIRVRQPLQSALVAPSSSFVEKGIFEAKQIILAETNLKDIKIIDKDSEMLSKTAKPNFKLLGPKYGSKIQEISRAINSLNTDQIKQIEKTGQLVLKNGETITIEDIEVLSKEIEGYSVATNEHFSVALDVKLDEGLKDEGLAREFVNRLQNLRKEKDYLVTDRITIQIEKNENIERAFNNNLNYICNETLATELSFSSSSHGNYERLSLIDNIVCNVIIEKI